MNMYNVVWTSQSNSSKDSMPLGGYDTGCNVWVENDRLYLYLSQSGALDENCTLIKSARVSVALEEGCGLLSRQFKQELHLEDGYVSVQAGEEGDRVNFLLWASPDKSEISIEFDSEKPHKLQAVLENWRYRDREVTQDEMNQCRDYASGYRGKVVTLKDGVEPEESVLYFYHQNRHDNALWNALIEQQSLESVRDQIPNPLDHRIIGGMLRMDGAHYCGTCQGVYDGTDFEGHIYQTEQGTSHRIVITLHTACCEDIRAWRSELSDKAALPSSFERSVSWWNDYFAKSYIRIDTDNRGSDAFRIGRNYQLFRYMLGCNYYGEIPTKFNGGLFTFDCGKTPDYRRWSGASFTGQNQRLVYWPMLKSGDFEGMKPQLDFYTMRLPAARVRTRHFFGFDGAFFYEHLNLFGICTGAEYGWDRSEQIKKGLEDNAWVRLHYSSGLEFALMMLEHARYSGGSVDNCLDFAASVVEFYFNYYHTDENGILSIFPSTALETYKGPEPRSKDDTLYGCKNPMDVVAGLRCLLEILAEHADARPELAKYREYLKHCPELPCGVTEEGDAIFLPAESYDPKPFNFELPQLYRVYPYSPYGMTEEEIARGRNTYLQPYATEKMYLAYSWHQNGIFAARLGLYEHAWDYLRQKLDDAPLRFPAFWGPGHDWTPDHNHGGSGLVQLQEMLMQCDRDTIRLFPCWDRNIDVAFKLHAPGRTVVECELKKGEITKLKVTPEHRKSDVVVGF